MAAKQVANTKFKFSVTQMGVNTPGITSGGDGDVSVQESTTAKIEGAAVLVEKITQNMAAVQWGCEGPTKNSTAVTEAFVGGVFNIISTAVKTGADGKHCMRKGDFVMCTCTCTAPQKGSPPPPPVITMGGCKIEISDAGQEVTVAS
ncbi:MAG: hypothetical protein GY714_02475 [Desulfobacterales bacterium]|nr:hypothetical protein [Desulfobacterales bacterium]